MANNQYVNRVDYGGDTLIDITDTTAETGDVADGEVFYAKSGARSTGTGKYASAPVANGNANATNAILYGAVDSTSTATAYTATVAGLDQLVDGTCVMLRNGVVTSAAGFTINVNGLGAKPVYNSLATGNGITPTNPTQDSTIFNINYTMLFVYVESDIVSGGCWMCFRGYDSNTNTIGYQLRTNSGNKVASDTGYRYRLWLTSADGSKWVPINTSTSTNATSNRSLNTRAIDPFGPIVYRATNGTCNANAGIGATGIWQQYVLSIGYSYMASGFSLSFPDSVYLRCTPQADGSAVMQDIVQALPSSKDGKIYIHLGTAYSATNMELSIEHPVYWHDGTGIRIWTGAEPSSGSSVEPSSTTPAMDGTAAVGTATTYARADHVHPTDTSRQATLVSGTNIKTINGDSILGSGDLTVSGSVGYYKAVATIPSSGWTNDAITVDVPGVTESADVIVAPAPSSAAEWASCGILCTAQGDGTLTFTRSSENANALSANVMAFSGGSSILLSMSGTIDSSTRRYRQQTDFVPTVGESYRCNFCCSKSSIGSQGDATITASTSGGVPALVAGNDWFVQFSNGNANLYGSFFSGGESVELTVYG